MRIRNLRYSDQGWRLLHNAPGFEPLEAHLVLVFGDRLLLEHTDVYAALSAQYPNAIILLGSTAGEIDRDGMREHTICATVIQFDHTRVRKAKADIQRREESFLAGAAISAQLKGPDLKLIFVLSSGSNVNGSELVRGINASLDEHVSVSGGLTGDGTRFEKTIAGVDAPPTEAQVVAIGLYSQKLHVGHGTMGGWDVFGPERPVTRADYNVLYEIGGRNALGLYKEYLGKYAAQLPGAALLFPLALKTDPNAEPVVRTILSIDEGQQAMVFAGEIPEGAHVRFMKANFDRLVEASASAAQHALTDPLKKPDLAILISCVGRKLALDQRIDEEIEAAREVFGPNTVLTGFYSYGEISPLSSGKCDLHNQTMTITTLTE